eukprot:m.270471 g.270471  ORF g.270471 m.270471 type:complete len:55 (+) comp16080_c0_seq3:836-1000(+)
MILKSRDPTAVTVSLSVLCALGCPLVDLKALYQVTQLMTQILKSRDAAAVVAIY